MNELGYRKISWFVSVSQINYLPQSSASVNNWSARHLQITIFSWTLSNKCLSFSCLSKFRGAGLWDFTLEPVEYLRKLDKSGIYRITGSFDIVGVPIHVEVLTGMKYARPQFAVGFSFDQESFGKLSEQLSGIGVDFLDVIGLNLEVICRNVVTVRSLESVPYIANEVIIIIIIETLFVFLDVQL